MNIVTFKTKWNNIKPMLWSITFVMMIMSCCFATFTFQSSDFRQTSFNNSVSNCRNCFSLFALTVSSFCCFTLFGFPVMFLVTFLSKLTFFRLAVFFATQFTVIIVTVFTNTTFVKLRQRFNFLAFGTLFRYDLVSHNRFLNKRFWLEPLFASYTLASGSLYINQSERDVNNFLRKKVLK